jgi:pilus assembly protein Flp/PilA
MRAHTGSSPTAKTSAAVAVGFAKATKKTGSVVMKTFFARFAQDESGATAIEYGLIAALIAVAAISAMTTLGTKLTSTFTAVSNQLK